MNRKEWIKTLGFGGVAVASVPFTIFSSARKNRTNRVLRIAHMTDLITYYCNGAVSGNWWKGDYLQTPSGYALINLYEDGTFDREYVAYGWEKR